MTVNVANNAPPSVTNQVSVAGGGSAAATGSDATTIKDPCAINQGSTTTVADVLTIINEALGVTPTVDDLNSDGVVNVSDVQFVVNSALGLACYRS